jgi:hypothetical protein
VKRTPLVRRTPMPRGEVKLARTASLRARVTPATRAGRATLIASRPVVLARAAGRCECCGVPLTAVHVHHRRPRRAGGSRDPQTNAPSNLLALLPACHERWESQRAEAVRRGLVLAANADPLMTPVLLAGQWVLLDDSGNLNPLEGAA